MNGKELATVIGNTCRSAGMDINHPVIRDAMIKAHMEIEKASPKSTDEQRARFVIGAKQGLIDRIKSHFPEHFAMGGIVSDASEDQQETPVGAQTQPPSGNGQTALATGGQVGDDADNEDVPTPPGYHNPNTPDGPPTGPATDNSGSDAHPNPYPMAKPLRNVVDKSKAWLDAHPNTKATLMTAAAVPLLIGTDGEGAGALEGAGADLAGAGEGAAADSVAAGSELGARGATSVDAAAPAAETAAPTAAPGSVAERVVPKETAPTESAEGEGNENVNSNSNGEPNGNSDSTANSKDTDSKSGSNKPGSNGTSLLHKAGTVAKYGAAALGGAATLGGLVASKLAPPNDALDPTKVPPELQPGAPSPTDLANPHDAKLVAGNNPGAGDNGNAFTNSQENLNQSTQPITGMQPGLNQSVNTASHYAATQTPEAMRAAQADKGAVYSAGLGASLTPFGGGGANTQGAIGKLATLGEDNLKEQQQYGNTSLHALNNSLNDSAQTQGANITNSLAGSARGVSAATNINAAKVKLQTDTQDFQTISNALSQMGPAGNDIVQTIFANLGKGAAATAAIAKIPAGPQRDAALAVLAILQKPEHADLAKLGVLNANALTTTMSNQLKNDHIAAQGATAQGGVASGATTEMPQQLADGGVVQQASVKTVDKARSIYQRFANEGRNVVIQKMAEAGINPTTASTYYANFIKGFADGGVVDDDSEGGDLDESDLDDNQPINHGDIIKKAFGLMPKGSAVVKDEAAPIQDKDGNTVGEAHEVDMQSPVETSVVDEKADAIPSNEPTAAGGDIRAQVAAEAQKQGIDPKLALAVTKTESNFNPTALNQNTNGTADHGPMQVNDMNYSEGEDKSDVGLNIQKGVAYLKACSEKAGGDPQLAAYYYNHGLNSRINPQVVRNDGYANKVVANYTNA